MCTTLGAERSTSHFSQGRPLAKAAILAAILGEKIAEKLHLNAKVLRAKFGYKRPSGLRGVSGQTDRQTDGRTDGQTKQKECPTISKK